MPTTEPIRRTLEIEDKTNLFLIHPLSNRLVPILADLNVSPNAVSLCGMTCGISAGLAYNHLNAVLGFVLMIAWHVMDGADGQLARLTKTQSATGKVLDGLCDYVTFTSVYVGLAFPLSRLHSPWVWAVVALAGFCHAVQSASYESQRQDYDHWGCGRPSAAPAKVESRTSSIGQIAKILDRLYIGVQRLSTGVDKTLRQEMELAVDRPDMQALYREVFAKRVRQWSIMSANYRTLSIFVFTAIGYPLYYFFWDIIGLSLLSVLLLYRQRSLYERFFTRARASGEA